MAFNVRIFGHTGLAQIPVVRPRQFASDAIYQLEQPYEFRETVNVGAVAASSSPIADASGRPVTILYVDIPDGETIRYEVNPPARAVAASADSPSMSGKQYLYFRSGWTISMIDAAGL